VARASLRPEPGDDHDVAQEHAPACAFRVRQVRNHLCDFPAILQHVQHLCWLVCQRARGELYRLLVLAVREHGPAALAVMREEFERQWQGETLRYWPAPLRRGVSLAFAQAHEQHRDWAAGQLRTGESLPWADLDDLVSEAQEQARAWLALGQDDEARRLIEAVVRRANGITGEDYQFNCWLAWLDRLAITDPAAALSKLDWLARTIIVLRQMVGRSFASSAASRLVQTAGRLDPGCGAALAGQMTRP
jgi:hypothetical protein